MMISQGTPLLWAGDEWMRTQLGNNNAYSTRADNSFNWMDWGTWQAQDPRHRMHDFVKQVIAFRKSHQYAFAPLEYGQGAPFSWKNAQNNPADGATWGGKNIMMHFYDPTRGPELAILINGEANDVTFTLPQGRSWKRVIDTQSYFDLPETLVMQNKPLRASNNIWLSAPEPVTSPDYTAKPRTVTVLEAGN
jgi:glycogen operon protein